MSLKEQAWAYSLQCFSDEKLREIAQVAFDLSEPPEHVRFIHAFNVSNGYSSIR